MVSDGLFQNTASVLIDVTDVNDNAPEFDKQVYEITNVVEETVPPPDGQFLVQVNSTLCMLGNFSCFCFRLLTDISSILIWVQTVCKMLSSEDKSHHKQGKSFKTTSKWIH